MLRDFFFAAVSNSSIPSPLNGTGLDIDPSTAVGEKLWHLAHCLDYLRQTVVCTMDMTVEYPTLSAGGKPPAINGYEIEHVCRRRVSGVFLLLFVGLRDTISYGARPSSCGVRVRVFGPLWREWGW